MQHDHGYFEDDYLGHIGDRKLWRRIFGFILPQWRGVGAAVFLSLIITATGLALPRLIQLGIDQYIVNESRTIDERIRGVSVLAVVFFAIIFAGFVTNFFQVVVLEWTGQRIMHALRQRLFGHILSLDLSFFHAQPVGRLVTRLTNDIQNMHEMFTSVIVTLFNEGVRLIGIIAIMAWMNWRLTLILCIVLPIMLPITTWFGRLSRDAFRKIRTHLAAINAFIQETVSGITIIQLFLREMDILKRFTNLNNGYYRISLYQIKVFSVFVPLIEVMSALTLALIIWYGGGEILQKHMTIGILTAFISYMRLFFQPLRELSQKYSIVQSAMASAERIFQIIETPAILPAPPKPVIPEKFTGAIEFKNINFQYEPDRPVLKNFSFRVNPGETLAIVGATGSGKTTVINLLERFYDPKTGEITLDGVDLREMDLHWLREQIGLVMQDVFVIPATIRENVLLDQDLSEERLQEILSLSQLASMTKALPQGIDTRVGEGAMELSAGQRQLLAFARVLARNPRILVLDEATANVDTETEMLIERAIQCALAGRTSIVIAHRLSTIRRAHRILVMDDGRIMEQGSHEDLMGRQGLYYHLQTLQNGANAGKLKNSEPRKNMSAPY